MRDVFTFQGPVTKADKGRGVIAGHDSMTGSMYVHWDAGGATWENPHQLVLDGDQPPVSGRDV